LGKNKKNTIGKTTPKKKDLTESLNKMNKCL